MGRHATLVARGAEWPADVGRPVRVEVREPIDLLGRALQAALAALGLAIVTGGEGIPDVIVWAVDPDGGADALRLASAGAPVLALVGRAAGPVVAELRSAGARGVLARGAEPSTIAGAAVAVAGGYSVFPMPDAADATRGQVEPLTERELAWMRALARGAQVHGLAQDEGYSEREMYRKLRNTYRKLRVPGRTEALVALARANLLDAG